MLKFGNKEFRNLQEQVLANMRNIANIKEGTAVLSEFGIKVVGEVDTLAELPSVVDYKAAHEDWEYGDAFAVGTVAPYTLYILTRENDTITADHWFDIGQFPAPGPQGETGPQGEVGPQGPQGNTGDTGADAGFGSILATAQTLPAGSQATATVVASGPNTAKEFSFTFGLPRGADGGSPVWGNIQGTLSDQTDLQDALDAKQDELVSGTNIKTVNNQSVLGSGNIEINSGVWGNITGTLADQTDLANALAEKQPVIDASHKLSASYVSGLATVATTGAYADLAGKPTIGTGTITIKKNGETIDSFGLNQTADQNINIAVPTKTSDLSNDSGFTTKTYVDGELALKQDVISDLSTIRSGAAAGATAVQPADLATVATTGDYDDLIDKPDLSIYVTDVKVDGSSVVSNTVAEIDLSGKQDVISDLSTIRSGAALGATAVQPAAIANMVTTTGFQTISGKKVFTAQTELKNTTTQPLSLTFDKDTSAIEFYDNDNDAYTDLTTSNSDSFTRAKLVLPSSSGTIALVSQIPTNNNQLINGAGYIKSTDISHMVTDNSAQTITGAKTFSGNQTSFINNTGSVDPVFIKAYEDEGISFLNNGEDAYTYLRTSNHNSATPATIYLPDESGTLALISDIPTNNNQLTNGAGYITGSYIIANAAIPSGSPALQSLEVNGTVYEITGSSPSNMVTTDTTQTISGNKTLSGTTTFSGSASFTGTRPLVRPASTALQTYDLIKIAPDDGQSSSWTLYVNTSNTSGDDFRIKLPEDDGTLALTSQIPSVPVTDVTVGGTSVVSSGTAIIPAILGTSTETWTFTLSDGTTTTKTIVLG